MKTKHKRTLAVLMLLSLILSLFSGCGGRTENQDPAFSDSQGGASSNAPHTAAPMTDSGTMGRFLEVEIPLPDVFTADGVWVLDMVQMNDGSIRIGGRGGDKKLYTATLAPGSQEWSVSAVDFAAENVGVEQALAVSTDGGMFFSTGEGDDKDRVFHLWYMDPQGAVREIPADWSDMLQYDGFLATGADFTSDGRLIVSIQLTHIRELDPVTGAFGPELNELGQMDRFKSSLGSDFFLATDSGGTLFHADGTSEEMPDFLMGQFENSIVNTGLDGFKLAVARGSDGTAYYAQEQGLFSCVPGGSVTEQLISGSRCSMGDPSFDPRALAAADDGSFYLLGKYDGGGFALCHYTWSADTPTEPSGHLRIYSLYEDDNLSRLVSQFQKAHPDTSLDLEVGVPNEGGVTAADALRTLNTQILAGEGPDLFKLDGFSLQTYLDKGILADLSDVLAEAESGDGLISQVTSCFRQDGKICAVPTCFALPAIYGPTDLISQVKDLPSLVEMCKTAREQNTEADRFMTDCWAPSSFGDNFYDSCSAAWLKADGTMDEQAIRDFYAAMQEIYAMDEDFRQENADMIKARRTEEANEIYMRPGYFTGVTGAEMIVTKYECLNLGTLDGFSQYEFALTGSQELSGYDVGPMNAQASHVFMPRRILGVNAASANVDSAKAFVRFVLSKDVQIVQEELTGFPVNRAAFQEQLETDKESTSVTGMSSIDGEEFTFYGLYPSRAQRDMVAAWIDGLTTPSLTNQTIREVVLEQLTECLDGKLTPDQAASAALQKLNLYLSE